MSPDPPSGGAFDPEMTLRIPRRETERAPTPGDVEVLSSPPPPPAPAQGKRRDTPKTFALPAAAARDHATLTIVRGASAGRFFAFRAGQILIGRDPAAEIPVEDTAVSRHHARIVRRDDGHYAIEDLGSTNGTFVGGQPIAYAVLAPDDRIHIGPTLVLQFAVTDEDEAMLQRRLYEASTRDGLTGAFNRLAFEERLATELDYASRTAAPVSVLALDLDHFKAVNDGPGGHLAGDAVLRAFAAQVHATIRAVDLFARVGGEEFAIVARGTSAAEAAFMAERIRVAVEQMRVRAAGAEIGITVSIGVACSSEGAPGDAPSALVGLADARLYAVKESGRNRVCSQS